MTTISIQTTVDVTQCDLCGHRQNSRHEKPMITIPIYWESEDHGRSREYNSVKHVCDGSCSSEVGDLISKHGTGELK